MAEVRRRVAASRAARIAALPERVPGVWDRRRLALQGVRVADDVVRSGRSAVPVFPLARF